MGDENERKGGDFLKSGKDGDCEEHGAVTNSLPQFLYHSLIQASPITRLEHLEKLIINTSANRLRDLQSSASSVDTGNKILSVESLLDCLIVLFDECQNSSLRREKTVSEFLELRKYSAHASSG